MDTRRAIGAGLALLAVVLLVGGLRSAVGAGDGRVIEASRVAGGGSATASLDPGTYDVREEPATGAAIALSIRPAGPVESTGALPLLPPEAGSGPARVRVPAAGRYLIVAGPGASELVLVEPAEADLLGALPGLLLGAILAAAGVSMLLGHDPRVAFRRWSGASSG